MKAIIFLVLAACIISCGGNSGKDTTTTSTTKEEVKDPEAAKGLELITRSDCFTCHKLTEKNIGPAYADVAKKYKTLNDATMDSIVTQIMKGGKGKWGNVPMMPHPAITKEDAQLMAHYIMSIKP